MLRTEQRLLGGGLPGYLFGVLGRKALVALRAVGVAVTAMAPRAVRSVVWAPSRATFSTSMAQAFFGGLGYGLGSGLSACVADIAEDN